jgi:hypothetical protein
MKKPIDGEAIKTIKILPPDEYIVLFESLGANRQEEAVTFGNTTYIGVNFCGVLYLMSNEKLLKSLDFKLISFNKASN